MKKLILFLCITIVILMAAVLLLQGKGPSATDENVTVVDGKQIIRIDAKGGYAPRQTKAKANMPTTLNVKTNGTYDCSAAIVIPRLNYRSFLPPSGTTVIELPPQPSGTIIKGTCAMGMYNFALNFN